MPGDGRCAGRRLGWSAWAHGRRFQPLDTIAVGLSLGAISIPFACPAMAQRLELGGLVAGLGGLAAAADAFDHHHCVVGRHRHRGEAFLVVEAHHDHPAAAGLGLEFGAGNTRMRPFSEAATTQSPCTLPGESTFALLERHEGLAGLLAAGGVADAADEAVAARVGET